MLIRRDLYLHRWHWIDTLGWMTPASAVSLEKYNVDFTSVGDNAFRYDPSTDDPYEDAAGGFFGLPCSLSVAELVFSKFGWNREREVQVLWLPPFCFWSCNCGDTLGALIYHVKLKDYDGTSLLLTDYNLARELNMPPYGLFAHPIIISVGDDLQISVVRRTV